MKIPSLEILCRSILGHTTKKQLNRGSIPEASDLQDCALRGSLCVIKDSFLFLSQDFL